MGIMFLKFKHILLVWLKKISSFIVNNNQPVFNFPGNRLSKP